MDIKSLQTASLYINNQLLSRGLIRHDHDIDFAHPDVEKGGLDTTMGRIVGVINDLILRRDRDAAQREDLINANNTLRSDAQRFNLEVDRLKEAKNELGRKLAIAEAEKKAYEDKQKTSETRERSLKIEVEKLRGTVSQIRAMCAVECRKKEKMVEGLKKSLGDASRIRGGNKTTNSREIIVTAGINEAQPTKSTTSVEAEGYQLHMETNEFLTELAGGLSEENEYLLDLIRRTLDSLKKLSGWNQQTENMMVVAEVEEKNLKEDLEAVMIHIQKLLTNPGFVPLEEVEIREEEILRLREGWEYMETRWKEAVSLMDIWKKRMMHGSERTDIEELKPDCCLDPRRPPNNDAIPFHLSTVREESEVEDEDKSHKTIRANNRRNQVQNLDRHGRIETNLSSENLTQGDIEVSDEDDERYQEEDEEEGEEEVHDDYGDNEREEEDDNGDFDVDFDDEVQLFEEDHDNSDEEQFRSSEEGNKNQVQEEAENESRDYRQEQKSQASFRNSPQAHPTNEMKGNCTSTQPQIITHVDGGLNTLSENDRDSLLPKLYSPLKNNTRVSVLNLAQKKSPSLPSLPVKSNKASMCQIANPVPPRDKKSTRNLLFSKHSLSTLKQPASISKPRVTPQKHISTPTSIAKHTKLKAQKNQAFTPIPKLNPDNKISLPRIRGLPVPPSPVTMASISAKLATSKRDADAARVRAKLNATRSAKNHTKATNKYQSLQASKLRDYESPESNTVISDHSPLSDYSTTTKDPSEKAWDLSESSFSSQDTMGDEYLGEGYSRKRKANDMLAKETGRSNRRKSTLSSYELESLIRGE
ncbi:BgTH12-06733 [Blumeria graminis f. sp. triticale]|uniref:Bgt-5491 n=3 Tax=Blumeria graminis TaxID=34373 RepID=A0A061HE49_BLUGR|nr:hypothetical protein BGT96224_5491 [Blumeria graminis f. sp. tritici 96224]CAD6501033.1 BgTH12-06733 [Blumeria graminis f. sp. triticale]VCU41343.1 Bgt-5491 [Blumeria graminis f. sp. tritici]